MDEHKHDAYKHEHEHTHDGKPHVHEHLHDEENHEHGHDGETCGENGHGHTHCHDGGEHSHTHGHEECGCGCSCGGHSHNGQSRSSALIKYMLEHNEHHVEELQDMVAELQKQGQNEAADKITAAAAEFNKGNKLLSEALQKVQ